LTDGGKEESRQAGESVVELSNSVTVQEPDGPDTTKNKRSSRPESMKKSMGRKRRVESKKGGRSH